MRIGILTLHSGANYGGTLQCYALYRLLCDLGHNVEVIDFVPTQRTDLIKRLLYAITSIRNITDIKNLISRTTRIEPKVVAPLLVSKFDDFRKSNIKLSSSVDELTIANVNENYDAIIVGSDQVWSSFVRNKLTYFGDWSPKYTGCLISYAACATNDRYPIVRKKFIGKLLARFDAISVRDKMTSEIVSKLTGYSPTIVQDPTILYDFNNIEISTPIISNPYIFVYVLGKEINGTIKHALELMRNYMKCNLKIIASNIYGESCVYADKTLTSLSPYEWLNLVKHAQIVFTDSFHASVFAMKFRANLISYYVEENRASRLKNLFESTNLSSFLVTNTNQIVNLLPKIRSKSQYDNFIDFDKKSSISFLIENLK